MLRGIENRYIPLIVFWYFVRGLELSTCSGLFMAQPAANFTVYSPHGLFADVIAIEARHSPHLVEWPIPLVLRGWTSHTEPSTHTNLAYIRSTEAREELLYGVSNFSSWYLRNYFRNYCTLKYVKLTANNRTRFNANT